MSGYLDIIRSYRPATAGLVAGSSTEKIGATPHADREGPEKKWSPRVEDVLAEIGRPGSGPAMALGTYVEKPNAERLCWLTKSVLKSLGMETDDWERCVPVVVEAAAQFGEDANVSNET